MSEETKTTFTYRRITWVDIEDGPRVEESHGWGSNRKTRTVQVVKAIIQSGWSASEQRWSTGCTLKGRWVLKDGTLGKEEHEVWQDDTRKLKGELIEQYRPRTVVKVTEVPQ